jgi:hypothetical protein
MEEGKLNGSVGLFAQFARNFFCVFRSLAPSSYWMNDPFFLPSGDGMVFFGINLAKITHFECLIAVISEFQE